MVPSHASPPDPPDTEGQAGAGDPTPLPSMLAVLARADVCRDFPAHAAPLLMEAGRQRTFRAGSAVLRRGDSREALHVILSGRVHVEHGAGDRSTSPLPRELGPGEVVGTSGLADGGVPAISAIALEETVTLELGLSILVALGARPRTIVAALQRSLGLGSRKPREALAARRTGVRAARGGPPGQPAAGAVSREEAARLEGALLVARTLEHHLNNQLALTVGYCELVADDPRLPSDLRPLVLQARAGAEAAAKTVRMFEGLRRVRAIAQSGLPPLLDLEHALS